MRIWRLDKEEKAGRQQTHNMGLVLLCLWIHTNEP